MEEAGFDRALASSDLVITGEGRIDEQTAYGKTALGVAERARAAGRACIAIGGGVTPEGSRRSLRSGAIAVPVVESPAGRRDGDGRRDAAGRAVRRADRALFDAAFDLPAATPHLPRRPEP